ncbi:S-adenosyl-L-methionine-dependent methyltransferase [Suillus subaureus]|uniref:S-adenosyl-L-methionine-dependent methyltransferase n=1 Tax=Suillus subaureus TaxID=48587 RepID=A0A9P7ECN2_9AGAM|nr:S-adenosyl-L-methionine-dependent methyltransferase [Suillus subaureus]KAG1817962.1 S-adenosyl-L-methionine-dependent methyltransferase [Suillus subaureus]
MANKAKLEALLTLINTSARDAIALYEQYGDVPAIDQTEPHPLDDAVDQVALKSAIRTLEGACAQICTTLAPPAHTAINLVQVYDYACMRVAARENISNILLSYPKGLHVNELSKKINIEPKKLARIMRLLATRGCYNEVDMDVFANNRVSLILLNENPVRHMILLHVESTSMGASVLYETLKDPKIAYSYDPVIAPVMYAINKNGTEGTFFDWMARHDGQRESYHTSMRALNVIMGSLAVLTHFPFEKYSTVVDVGGGIGAFSLPLAKTHKNVKITIHDLPEALVQARGIWARECPEALAENRVQFEELNFFEQVPVKGKDIYYLRNIIHDWPDHESALILSNLRKALGPNSRVLIHDYVLGQLSRKQAAAEASKLGVVVAPEPLLANFGVGNMRAYQQDMTMWLVHNAKERTLQDCLGLATAAGLKLEKVWDLAEACVLEYSAA